MMGEGNQRKGEIESRCREREIKVYSNTQEGDKQTTKKKIYILMLMKMDTSKSQTNKREYKMKVEKTNFQNSLK